jgi:PBSX family phage terminase large subunit
MSDFDTLLERRLSRAQLLSIVDSDTRKIACWYGSVSAGKTIASLIAFLFAIRRAPKRGSIVIIGKTLSTIYSNVFLNLLDEELFGPLIGTQIQYTPGATTAHILGREVLLVGANDAKAVGNIQGKTIALAYVDEAALLKEPFWNMLITRLRVPGARLLATMNPASRNHWMNREWIKKRHERNLIAFHFTMRDNPGLPDGYEDDMRRMFSGVFFERMIRGVWSNAEGAIYPMWDPKRHQIAFDDALPRVYRIIGTGIDFGTSNASAALMLGITEEKKPRLILLDEWRWDPRDHHGQRMAPSDQAAAYRKWLGDQKNHQHHPTQKTLPPVDFQIIDPAAAHFREELAKAGIVTWEGGNSVNDVLGGIATVSRMLNSDRLVVTDRCKGFLSEVTEYRWDEKATAVGEDAPVKEDDHSLDAARYIIHGPRAHYEYELAA